MDSKEIRDRLDKMVTLLNDLSIDWQDTSAVMISECIQKEIDGIRLALSSIDHEAIRRECLESIRSHFRSMAQADIVKWDGPGVLGGAMSKELFNKTLEYAILGAEPAHDDGKPVEERYRCNHCQSEVDEEYIEYAEDGCDGEGDYRGICPVCGEFGLVSVKPAQDDGKADAFASSIVKELRVNWAFDTEDALSVLNGATRLIEEAKK